MRMNRLSVLTFWNGVKTVYHFMAEKGKPADLIVVSDNPLDNIYILRILEMIF